MTLRSGLLFAGLMMAACATAQAEPGGCLKYGAAGGVAGHFAGHHTVLGAAGGCAAGAWRRHEYRKHERAAAREHRDERGYANAGRP